VLSFTTFVSLTTGILFGLIPAVQASRADLSDALQASNGHSGTGFRQNKARSLLVVTEVTLALVLLAGAGLLIRTFVALRSVDPGFDPHNVLTMRISLTAPRFQKTSGVADLVWDSVQRISALPGVVATAFTCCLPFEDRTIGDVIIAGRPLDGRSHGVVNVTTVSPGYFEVFKIPILGGRGFKDSDRNGGAPVVIINEAMARRFWPRNDGSGDPLKGSLVFPDLPTRPWQIVGIAGDVHADGLSRKTPPIVYFSAAQAPEGLNAYLVRSPMAWVVRTRGEPHAGSLVIQKELREASGGLPVASIRSMDEILVRSTAGREFNMLLLSIFGGSALVLAAIGIYGLMAYSVQQRTKEIGIRMALGAKSSDVRNMVLLQGMRLILVGVAIGIPTALSLTRFIASFLFGVKAQDPVVFGSVPIFLSAVAIFAVWLPARRASRMNPIEALRHE
jgi:putative ABC transport system permease protein